MGKSLLEELPKIVAAGKAQAERILEGLEGLYRVGLQTREWVLPSKAWLRRAGSAVPPGKLVFRMTTRPFQSDI